MQKETDSQDELFHLFICSEFTAEDGLNDDLLTHRSDNVASETLQNKTKTTTLQPYEPSSPCHIASLQAKEIGAENLHCSSLQMAKMRKNQYSSNECNKSIRDSDVPISSNIEHREVDILDLKDPVVSENNRIVEQQLCCRCHTTLVDHKENHADVMESTNGSKLLPTETHDMRHETFRDTNNLVSLKERHPFLEDEDSIADRNKTDKPDISEDTSIFVNQNLFVCENLCLKNYVHTHRREKPYHCDQCDKSFTQNSTFVNHLRIHSGEKPFHFISFQCDQCDKAYSWESALTKHLRTHSGEKPFQCDQCDKAFAQKSNLTTHLKIHSGEKPFQCDQCDKTFTQKSDLTRHLRMHGGEKAYACELCGKSFKWKGHLTVHLRIIHSGKKPYQCD